MTESAITQSDWATYKQEIESTDPDSLTIDQVMEITECDKERVEEMVK